MEKKINILPDYIVPAVSGILLTACQPTGLKADFGFLAWIALVPLLIVLPGRRPIELFRIGLIAGLAHFLTGLYWLTHTLYTYGNLPKVGAFFVMLLLVVLETSYLILFTLACGTIMGKRPKIPLVIAAPVLWVAIEYMRTVTPFGGFPWLLIGYSNHAYSTMIQIADITGVYGVSFLIVMFNAAAAAVIISRRRKAPLPWKSVVATLLLVALTAIYGHWRIGKVYEQAAKGAPLKVSLLQGNIAQDVKWSPAEDDRIIGIYTRLTAEAAGQGAEFIVWPEASTPFAFERDTRGIQLSLWLKSLGTYTLVGSIDYYYSGPSRKSVRFTNSAYLVGPEGITGKYSKIHLVPFGEYLPFSKWLGFVDKIVKGATGNFNSGEKITLFTIPQGRFGLVICYEAIFGDLVRHFRNQGADLLVNITNDAWFGKSSSPWQHLSMAAFRCAENHCYLVRAANTGISAVVDPTGKIVDHTGLYVEAVLDAEVKMMPGQTVYSRFGDVFAWIVFALAAAWGMFELERKIREKRS